MKTSELKHRDFIWECDYGEREGVVNRLAKILNEQNAYELGMCSLFVNNNPYNLEFFVVLGYEVPMEYQIAEMKMLMAEIGARYRPDITFNELQSQLISGRFNSAVVSNQRQLKTAIENLFIIKERKELAEKNPMIPLGNRLPVFLSYTSYNKPFVEDVIPYLTRYGFPVWYDRVNIDYGQSIVAAMQKGIKDSCAVIFFISRRFLSSSWCEKEMEGFLHKYGSGSNLLVLSIVFPDVNHNDLPIFLQNLKYFKLSDENNPEEVAKELVPTLKRYFKF